MESVTLAKVPSRRTACSQAIAMSMMNHRMRPGRSSLNDLSSKEPMEGLSSRPMYHYTHGEHGLQGQNRRSETHVVNEVSRVSAECEERARAERGGVAVDGLDHRHENRGGLETNPVFVDECQGGRSVAVNDPRRDTKGQQHGGERCIAMRSRRDTCLGYNTYH